MGTVFFSWQSDRSSKVNKNFIFNSLEKALREINKELKILEPERGEASLLKADQDTQDVPGHPDIFATILTKIENSDLFIPDFSLVAKTDAGKFIPNPNVMIEYGYALKVLGPDRIIPIMNDYYGDFSNLPFDLRTKRAPLAYNLNENADPETITQIRESFVKSLMQRIKPSAAKVKTQISTADLNTDSLIAKYIHPLQSTIHMTEQDVYGSPIPITGMFIITVPNGNWNADKLEIKEKVNNALRPLGRLVRGFSTDRWQDGVEVFESVSTQINLQQDGEKPIRRKFAKFLHNGRIVGFDKFIQHHSKDELKSFGCKGIIPSGYVEKYMIEGLKNFISFYKSQTTFAPPIQVIVGLYNVYDYKLALPRNSWDEFSDKILQSTIVKSFNVTNFSEDIDTMLEPFFKDIWAEADLQRPSEDIIAMLRR